MIAVGVAMAIYGFGRALVLQQPENYVEVRLTLARYLALAIEFELAADILSTAIAPSWDQIGKLGAIVVIRTGLNYFLMREMKEERLKGAGQVNKPGVISPLAQTSGERNYECTCD